MSITHSVVNHDSLPRERLNMAQKYPRGYFFNRYRYTLCAICAPGTYNYILCAICAPGTYNYILCAICVPGTYNYILCAICIPGTYNYTLCAMCAPGTYNHILCAICVPGTYISATKKKLCPVLKTKFIIEAKMS